MTPHEPVPFATAPLPPEPTVTAPDGSDVRVLLALSRGSMAHFEIAPGRTTHAVRHRTVEELWFVVSGRGQMWRRWQSPGGEVLEEVTDLVPGVSLSLPVGTTFQFRCPGDAAAGDPPLAVVAVTMPPWPGDGEAVLTTGPWPANTTPRTP